MKGFAKDYLTDNKKRIYKDLQENNICTRITLNKENHFIKEESINIVEEVYKNKKIKFFKKIPPKGEIGLYKNESSVYIYKKVRNNLYLKYKYNRNPFYIIYFYYCSINDELKKKNIDFYDSKKSLGYYYKYLKENSIIK